MAAGKAKYLTQQIIGGGRIERSDTPYSGYTICRLLGYSAFAESKFRQGLLKNTQIKFDVVVR